jgi:hypothetical protein
MNGEEKLLIQGLKGSAEKTSFLIDYQSSPLFPRYLLELSSFSLITCKHENTTRCFSTHYMSLHYSSFSHGHFEQCSIRTLALLVSNHAHVTSTIIYIFRDFQYLSPHLSGGVYTPRRSRRPWELRALGSRRADDLRVLLTSSSFS